MGEIININAWLESIIAKLKENFSDKLIFVGLQGSYRRNEATPNSDIDLVVILDKVDFEDLKLYREIIDSMPNKDKACGFISGRKELENWTKTDLFQFFYDTKPLYGKLSDITGPPAKEDIKKSIKINSENLYHAATHSYLHSKNYIEDLQNLYKMTFFVLQAKYFLETDNYISTKNELYEHLTLLDKEILTVCINKENIASKTNEEIEALYDKLIKWSSSQI